MCGIAGYIGSSDLKEKAQMMSGEIRHRGPDDQGIFLDHNQGVSLAFTRLSIQDLSAAGHQPMTSASGRYVIVFNGEIYNFQKLRQELEERGHVFKGHSDTEVVLGCFENWGIFESLQKFLGMFAIAVYDKKENNLILARDRLGKKPLYYGDGKDGFYFASEMKAILAAQSEKPAINTDVAALYFQWHYVPDPYSIYQGFHKVPAGHLMIMSANNTDKRELKAYWSFKDIADKKPSFDGSEAEAIDALETLLKDATSKRMIADVPVGAFLSGGIDSSLIVALMQQERKIKTFTIGFEESEYSEAPYARRIAEHLGTEHIEITIENDFTVNTIDKLPYMFDEPFGDASAIPTYAISKMAKEHMAVAVSGDGGDETFNGYSWYRRGEMIDKVPSPIRHLSGTILKHIAYSPQMRKMAFALKAKNKEEQYKALLSYWQCVDLGGHTPKKLPLPMDNMSGGMMAYDTVMFLPSDILTKVDRTSMAVSLEVRSPLLDHRIIEFGWNLPFELRRNKNLLKKLLERYVPNEMFERPKQGLIVPQDKWLRGILRDWAEDILHQDHELLNKSKVQQIWNLHQSGKANYGYLLWTILSFQNWYRHYKKY